jgi:hypothetical protein
MAWRYRITDVSATVGAVDVSLAGQFAVEAEYFDDAAPATILHTQRFQFQSTVTRVDAALAVRREGARVRDARARVAELQADVGTTGAV